MLNRKSTVLRLHKCQGKIHGVSSLRRLQIHREKNTIEINTPLKCKGLQTTLGKCQDQFCVYLLCLSSTALLEQNI